MAKRVLPARETGLFVDGAPAAKAIAGYRANIDGGSRGNPGPAAYGVVIRDPKGDVVAKLKKYIGRMTNNVAEYYGLIAALDYVQSQNIKALRIESDSELLVKQMRGLYKVRSPELQPLFERARKMSETLESFRIDHVYREQNREAANRHCVELLPGLAPPVGKSVSRRSARNRADVARETAAAAGIFCSRTQSRPAGGT